MRPLHVRKSRPSLMDAHKAAASGSYVEMATSNYISEEERTLELSKITNEIAEITKRHFPKTRNLEYAVLKSHLIVEHALTQFLRCSFPTFVKLDDINFHFSQKVKLAYFCGVTDTVLLPSIELLNQARNQVAHRFELKRNLIDELLRINAEDYRGFKISSDSDRIRGLKYLCNYISGRLAGRIEAHVVMSAKPDSTP